MASGELLRKQLGKLLGGGEAHATFDKAIEKVPANKRGIRPDGVPHSLWELVEHLRITQRDILDFCVSPAYHELEWPKEYWPPTPAPPSDSAWDESLAAITADREKLCRMLEDPKRDLFASVPNGTGQTYLREVLLVADHDAYHIGQVVLVRQLLGIWPAE